MEEGIANLNAYMAKIEAILLTIQRFFGAFRCL